MNASIALSLLGFTLWTLFEKKIGDPLYPSPHLQTLQPSQFRLTFGLSETMNPSAANPTLGGAELATLPLRLRPTTPRIVGRETKVHASPFKAILELPGYIAQLG